MGRVRIQPFKDSIITWLWEVKNVRAIAQEHLEDIFEDIEALQADEKHQGLDWFSCWEQHVYFKRFPDILDYFKKNK